MANRLITKHTSAYAVSIFIAGDYDNVIRYCVDYCTNVGLCVTVTPTNYSYRNGSENGVIVGLINGS